MKWTPEADAAVKKAPFFVRNRIRKRVEEEVRTTGKSLVSLSDVNAAKNRYLRTMASEIKGYQLDACFGPGGCPNRAIGAEFLVEQLEQHLKNAGLLTFLKDQVGEDLKFHHEFRVTVSECPNACSQPQIKDIGIIGARTVAGIRSETCTGCNACVEACPDDAIMTGTSQHSLTIDRAKCLSCGRCIEICPSGAIVEDLRGYRVLLGGKLGRHPQLARQLPGIHDEAQVIRIVGACVDLYKSRSRGGKRFAEVMTPADFEALAQRFGGRSG